MRVIDRLRSDYEKRHGSFPCWLIIEALMNRSVSEPDVSVGSGQFSDIRIGFRLKFGVRWYDYLDMALVRNWQDELRRGLLMINATVDHETAEECVTPLCEISQVRKYDDGAIWALEIKSLIDEEIRSVLISEKDVPAGWYLLHPSDLVMEFSDPVLES